MLGAHRFAFVIEPVSNREPCPLSAASQQRERDRELVMGCKLLVAMTVAK